jgi:endo-1,4-beta-xylanase
MAVSVWLMRTACSTDLSTIIPDMTNRHDDKPTRRSVLQFAAAVMCLNTIDVAHAFELAGKLSSQDTLKGIALEKGRRVALFSGQHELMTDAVASRIIASEFDMVAVGNDLKMNRIHPKPDIYDFSYGDSDLDWCKRNNMLFRGHTLVWHNALPSWFQTYVNKENAQRVMTDHITTVMNHYAGKLYSWDVVNEPIHAGQPNDRPDGLRSWPWLQLIGPEYLGIAFRTAAAADPKAKLVLNENNFEHDLPLHAERRSALLRVLRNLKKEGVPVHGLGTQGHVRANTPFATESVKAFYKEVLSLGLEVMITELDVDDAGIPAAEVDHAVAVKYAEYLDLVGPFATVITFEALADNPALPKRADGLLPRPNLFDVSMVKKPAYYAAAKAIADLPPLAPNDLNIHICR